MIHGPGCFFCMTSGRGLIHPLEWNTLCPCIARRNGHRLRQMRCKGKLISWSCLSCPYFLFLPLDLTWSRCCAALLAKFSEDSFFHVVTASEKACSTPSGCRWFGKGCDWRQSSFFETWSFHIWIKIDLKAELSIRLYIITLSILFFVMPCFFYHLEKQIKMASAPVKRAGFTHENHQQKCDPKTPGRFRGIIVILGRLASQRGGSFRVQILENTGWCRLVGRFDFGVAVVDYEDVCGIIKI